MGKLPYWFRGLFFNRGYQPPQILCLNIVLNCVLLFWTLCCVVYIATLHRLTSLSFPTISRCVFNDPMCFATIFYTGPPFLSILGSLSRRFPILGRPMDRKHRHSKSLQNHLNPNWKCKAHHHNHYFCLKHTKAWRKQITTFFFFSKPDGNWACFLITWLIFLDAVLGSAFCLVEDRGGGAFWA